MGTSKEDSLSLPINIIAIVCLAHMRLYDHGQATVLEARMHVYTRVLL